MTGLPTKNETSKTTVRSLFKTFFYSQTFFQIKTTFNLQNVIPKVVKKVSSFMGKLFIFSTCDKQMKKTR